MRASITASVSTIKRRVKMSANSSSRLQQCCINSTYHLHRAKYCYVRIFCTSKQLTGHLNNICKKKKSPNAIWHQEEGTHLTHPSFISAWQSISVSLQWRFNMFLIDLLLCALEIKLGILGSGVKPILCCSLSNIKRSNRTRGGCSQRVLKCCLSAMAKCILKASSGGKKNPPWQVCLTLLFSHGRNGNDHRLWEVKSKKVMIFSEENTCSWIIIQQSRSHFVVLWLLNILIVKQEGCAFF